jgi:hypothetical protein
MARIPQGLRSRKTQCLTFGEDTYIYIYYEQASVAKTGFRCTV